MIEQSESGNSLQTSRGGGALHFSCPVFIFSLASNIADSTIIALQIKVPAWGRVERMMLQSSQNLSDFAAVSCYRQLIESIICLPGYSSVPQLCGSLWFPRTPLLVRVEVFGYDSVLVTWKCRVCDANILGVTVVFLGPFLPWMYFALALRICCVLECEEKGLSPVQLPSLVTLVWSYQ